MAATFAHDALMTIEYGPGAGVLVIARDMPNFAREALALAGCRSLGEVTPADAIARLDRQAHLNAVLVVVGEGDDFDLLLDRIEADVSAGRYGAVVESDEASIDRVAARTPHPAIIQLVCPTAAERAEAVAAAIAERPARLHDVRRDQARLQQLSEEVGRIAEILAGLSENESPALNGRAEAEVSAAEIRAMIRARRLRDQFFLGDLFADPAWDMLLDLMTARIEKKRVAVSSLCIAAAVPPTTALRWIKRLTDVGMFVREADPEDGRRVYIQLSDRAAVALLAYLKSARRISPLAV